MKTSVCSAQEHLSQSPTHPQPSQPQRGRLIAFEGLDASGKSTQLRLTMEELTRRGIRHQYISFPRTAERGYGEAIAMFLRGEFGAVTDINPYLVAALFAGDRATSLPLLEAWLNEGTLVLVDRYFYSNLAFQIAKLGDRAAKLHFRSWLYHIEFDEHKIPLPDATIFFDVPLEFVKTNIMRYRPQQDQRPYLKGRDDIHESALDLQEKVAIEYRTFPADDPYFHIISCATLSGQMRAPDDICREVIAWLEARELLAGRG